jgi:hypothetical protein
MLSAEHVEVIAYRVVRELAHNGFLAVSDAGAAESRVNAAITDDLVIEEQLNEEVREIMSAHTDQIRSAPVESQDMFAAIKARLARERNIVI